MAINDDLKSFYSNALGYSADLPQLEYDWLVAQGAVGTTIPDLWASYLTLQGFNRGLENIINLPYPLSGSFGTPKYGPILNINGDFRIDITGWSLFGAPSTSVVNGKLTIIVSAASRVYQVIPTTVGKRYQATLEISGASASTILRMSNSADGSVGSNTVNSTSGTITRKEVITFTADTTSSSIAIVIPSATGQTTVDNCFVYEVLL